VSTPPATGTPSMEIPRSRAEELPFITRRRNSACRSSSPIASTRWARIFSAALAGMASKPLNAAPLKKPPPAPTTAQAGANGPHPRPATAPATAPAPAPSSPPMPTPLAAPPRPIGPDIVADTGALETTPTIPSVARIPASSGGGGFGVEEQPTTAMSIVTRKPITNGTWRASGAMFSDMFRSTPCWHRRILATCLLPP
jgi:hypothetical protein